MAATWLVVYRGLLLVALLLGVVILALAVDQQGKPGFRPFLGFIAGGLIYVVTKLVVSFVRGTPAVFVFTRFNPLGAGLVAVGFTLFVLEYTGIEQPISRRTGALLFFLPAFVNITVWLDRAYLWIPAGRDASTVSGYAWDIQSVAIANQVYLNLVVIAGLVLLIWYGLRSAAPFNTHVSALVLAGIGPLIGNIVFQIGYVPLNVAPIMTVLSAGVILWVMTRGQFLDLVPISRDVVIESIETGVLTVDTDQRIVDINRAARQLLELGDDHVIGQDLDEVLRDHTPGRAASWSRVDLDSDETLEWEFGDRHYEIDVTDLTWADGRERGRSFLIRDMTAQRNRKRDLERANETLERLLSVISHDIRNPLNVIQGRARVARDGDDVETQLESIQSSANRIDEILSDALTLTRETDPVTLEAIDLSAVAERGWDHVETDGVTLETACECSIECDPGRVEQLFENVFRNAIEHGDSVTTVRVGAIDSHDATSRGFFIADDGAGIPEEARQRVLEDGYTTSEDGTGLGLSIVSGIVESHGWQMRITDSQSGGARFDITGVTGIS